MPYINGRWKAKMPAPYPLPGNMTGVSGLFSHGNTLTNDMFVPLGMLVIFIAALIILIYKNYRPSDSLATSSMITFILGAFLWSAQLLNDKYIIAALALAVLSLIWSIFDKK